MSIELVSLLGRVVVVLGAALELRHLASAVLKQFDGCTNLRSVADRAFRLDDATLIGVAMCIVLAAALVLTVATAFGFSAETDGHLGSTLPQASPAVASRG